MRTAVKFRRLFFPVARTKHDTASYSAAPLGRALCSCSLTQHVFVPHTVELWLGPCEGRNHAAYYISDDIQPRTHNSNTLSGGFRR